MRTHLAGFMACALLSMACPKPAASWQSSAALAMWDNTALLGRQAVLEKPARLELDDKVPLSVALDRLSESSGVPVAYSASLLPAVQVLCRCKDVTVGEAVARILRGTEVEFLVVSDRLVFRGSPVTMGLAATRVEVPSESKLDPETPAPPSPMAGTIAGRVRDVQTGAPLSGVQVSISELNTGGLSQATGAFILVNVPAGTYTMRAQLLGYATETREVEVVDGETATVNFTMREEALQLDAIVVTGTPGGTQRRAIGNVVSNIDAASVTDVAPVTTVEQLIGSRVPGVVSISGSGVVGADASIIRVRSATSPSLAGNPLVYVDGVRINSDVQGGRDSGVSRLNDINPNDIESIEVIKGPAAATLYGTEAANGVIQIITKKGRSGAPTFNAFTEVGANWLANPKDVAPVNYAISRTTGELLSEHLPTAEVDRGTNFLQNGPVRRTGIAVSGGTERVRYYGSYTRGYQEGVVDWNWEHSDAARTSIGLAASEWLDIDFALNYNTRQTRLDGGWWANMTRGTPLTAAEYGGADSPLRGWDVTPEEMRDASEDMSEVQRFGVSLTANLQPTAWLKGRMTLGLDWTDALEYNTTFRREADSEFGFDEGSRDVSDNTSLFHTVDLSLTATHRMDRLGTATSGGLQYNKRRDWTYAASGDEFASPVLSTVGSAARTTGDEDYSENVGAGFYVQEQVDWDSRIFLTGAIRMDDNSAFGTNFDAAIYPKVSGTWVVHEEKFFNVDWVSALRLRGAWGAAGRQPNIFDAARVYEAVTGAGDSPSLTPVGYGNPDLGPERSEELEVGFDAGLFDDRLNLAITHYWRNTSDAIVSRSLAPGVGFPGDQLLNVGAISGWGTEAQIGFQALDREGLQWSLDLGLASMHSRIDDLGGIDRIPVGRSRQHIQGYPLASVFNVRVLSADFQNGTSGRVTNILCDGGAGPDGHQAGGEAVPCSKAALIYQGPGEPTWNASLTSTLTFRQDIQLYTSIDGRGGNVQHVDGIAARHTSWSNSLARAMADDPIFMAYTQVNRNRLATFDASFFRLREVGLRYELPEQVAARVNASRLSLGVAARNLPYLWRAEPFTKIGHEPVPSPEVVITSGVFIGESHSSQPPSTMLTFTVRATF